MRIPVVALALLQDDVTPAEIFHASDTVTRITHPYPQCMQTSRLLTSLTRDLVVSGDKEAALARTTARFPNTLDTVNSTLRRPRPHTGGNLETTAIALNALMQTTSYREAVMHAINASTEYGTWATDSDTYGAVAGALAGAAYGASAIPESWRRPMDLEGKPITIGPVPLEKIGQFALQTAGLFVE
jgi:ADP-ribosyl-[dinitrogen reductase] hydrolase